MGSGSRGMGRAARGGERMRLVRTGAAAIAVVILVVSWLLNGAHRLSGWELGVLIIGGIILLAWWALSLRG